MEYGLKKLISPIVLWVICCSSVHTQSLGINQQCPDLTLTNVFNNRVSSLELVPPGKKLVILDFWSTSCLGCIQSFSKIDSLQKSFYDKVQIIMVNQENRDSTQRFFSKRKKIQLPAVPFITGDSLLNKLFPHDGVPFHVWLDSNRIVRFITNGYNTNSLTINSFLKGEDVQLNSFHTGRVKVKAVINKEYEEKLEYFSFIAHCIDGNQQSYSDSLLNRSARLYSKCASATELYIMAFNERDRYDFSRPGKLVLELKDSLKYMRPKDEPHYDQWRSENAYNYELIVPKESEGRKFEIMKEDLKRYFGINAKVEKRKTTCFVLERIAGKDKLGTKGGIPKNSFYRSTPDNMTESEIRMMQNYPYEDFSKSLEIWIEREYKKPFADNTGYKGNIDISLRGETVESLDMGALKNELKKYNLAIAEKENEIEVLVIADY